MGAGLNAEIVKTIKARMICGCANNVLVDAATGDALSSLGIVYCPDYIVNAGGIINCVAELEEGGYKVSSVEEKVEGIYRTTLNILGEAKQKGISTAKAADEYAMGIIMRARK